MKITSRQCIAVKEKIIHTIKVLTVLNFKLLLIFFCMNMLMVLLLWQYFKHNFAVIIGYIKVTFM